MLIRAIIQFSLYVDEILNTKDFEKYIISEKKTKGFVGGYQSFCF